MTKQLSNFILAVVGFDGLLHILLSNILVVFLRLIVPLYISVIIVALIGLYKEFIHDKKRKKGVFSYKDLFCNAFGIVLGCL